MPLGVGHVAIFHVTDVLSCVISTGCRGLLGGGERECPNRRSKFHPHGEIAKIQTKKVGFPRQRLSLFGCVNLRPPVLTAFFVIAYVDDVFHLKEVMLDCDMEREQRIHQTEPADDLLWQTGRSMVTCDYTPIYVRDKAPSSSSIL